MTLLLPRTGSIDLPAYALIIAHELAHAKGYKHREMYRTNRYWWQAGWEDRYSYATQFPIEAVEKPSREAITSRRQQVAVDHAHKMVAKWTTTAKRAGTQLAKWRTRLEAAERRVKQPPKSLPLPSSPAMKPEPMLSLSASASS